MIAPLAFVLLAAAAAPAFESPQELQEWLTYYYLKPRPELILPSLDLLDRQIQKAMGQTLGDQARRGGMRAFYAQVLAHDDAVAGELARKLPSLPPSQQPFAREALRRCGTAACRATVKPKPPLSGEGLDDLWGSFAATGDEAYVREVIARVVSGKSPRLSLRSNAYQHSRVLQVCEVVLAHSDGEARRVLEDIVGLAKAERQQHPPAEPQ